MSLIPYLHPVLSCAEALAWEKSILHGESPEWEAMSRAGRTLGRAILLDYTEWRPFPERPRILVLAGKGHNAGDAFLAADYILRKYPQGEALVLPAFEVKEMRGLTQRAYRQLESTGRVNLITTVKTRNLEFDLAIDGLLGMQFQPPVKEPIRGILEMVNRHRGIGFRVAVDLPSGLGDYPFQADFTYATGIVKSPVLEKGNEEAVGRLRYLDIGFFDLVYNGPREVPEDVISIRILRQLSRLRPAHSDKRTFGHLFILSGSRTMPGAVAMAAMAALRSGVGLVTAFVPESVASRFVATIPEVMWVPWPETPDGGLALEGRNLFFARAARADALLIGPGLGREAETLTLVRDIVKETHLPVVLDADALDPVMVDVVAGRSGNQGAVVATPHAGEYQRMAGLDTPVVDRESFRWFAHKNNMVIVCKGPVTKVTDGKLIGNSLCGGPVLARGGSGDILSGLIAGILARQSGEPMLSACQGVVWHGLAADELARAKGQVAVRTTELLDYLHPVLRNLA